MFERYTETARKVIFAANYLAREVGSTEIGSEHLLMGLLCTDKVLARRFLGTPWAAEVVWKRVELDRPLKSRILGPREIMLSEDVKRVLHLAAEEADRRLCKSIDTGHMLVGLLTEDRFLAGKILADLGISATRTRDDLMRVPHNDSTTEEFVRDISGLTPEMLALKAGLKQIRDRLYDAIADHDFERARACSVEELKEREKLVTLYHQYKLLDWMFEFD